MSETVCKRCGQFGDLQHGWVEGDCVLPHRGHSRKLVTGTFVCEPCTDRHREWLNEIVDLYADLAGVLYVGDVPEDGASEYQKPRKRPASPSPLRLTAWALLYGPLNSHVTGDDGELHHAGMSGLPDVPVVLANWAQAVFDAREWTATAPTTVSGAVAVLTASIEVVAGLADVDTFDAELRWVRRALRAAHGITDPMPLGRCLTVGCRGNVWPGGAKPQCDRCGRRYGTHDLVRLKLNEKVSGRYGTAARA